MFGPTSGCLDLRGHHVLSFQAERGEPGTALWSDVCVVIVRDSAPYRGTPLSQRALVVLGARAQCLVGCSFWLVFAGSHRGGSTRPAVLGAARLPAESVQLAHPPRRSCLKPALLCPK